MNVSTNQLIATSNSTQEPDLLMYVVLVYTVLEDKGFRFNNPCVGVLLRPDLVLTPLSCIETTFHGNIDLNLMYVYLRDSQVLKPERVFVYPDMKNGPNVALLLCESSSRVKDFPKLPEKEFTLGDFEYCTLCGFGSEAEHLNLKGFDPIRINKSDMEVCSKYTEGEEWICLHFENSMPCRGDVGAPLLCNGALHAIFNPTVSHWAPPSCQDVYGATFTRLHPVVPWIRGLNHTLNTKVLQVINSPLCWIAFGVTVLTIIAVIYYGLMKYVDWRCDKEDRRRASLSEDIPRVVTVKSAHSHVSHVSSRWLWPRREYVLRTPSLMSTSTTN